MGEAPQGFTFRVTAEGEVHVSHHGRVVTRMRGKGAEKLLRQLERAERAGSDSGERELQVQHLLARVTGNYKRGNERERKDGRR